MKILLATHNPHKVFESTKIFKELFSEDLMIDGLEDANIVEDVEESASTLLGNAHLKAKAIFDLLKHNPYDYIISEDFGFFIEAFPHIAGVHAKRWKEGTEIDRAKAVLELFKKNNEKNRSAKYVSVFVAIDKNGNTYEGVGELKGKIADYNIDTHNFKEGFAYDQILELEDGRVVSEYTKDEKAQISSRREAIKTLIKHIKKEQ
ncbi:MAG: non-canonical purine NTP pyrophosphatase [Spirochaetales bacterium]